MLSQFVGDPAPWHATIFNRFSIMKYQPVISIKKMPLGQLLCTTLKGIVSSTDPLLKYCRFKIDFFGPQRFVAGSIWNSLNS